MKIQITHRYDSSRVLHEGDYNDMLAAIAGAIAAKANLQSANLQSANLRGAPLRSADLSYANLGYANLQSANLQSANLRGADLRGADLSYADLSYADLSYADLQSANLSYANLQSANLQSANLSDANLQSANLRGADLRGANLRSADLRGADNLNSHPSHALIIAQTRHLPEGSLIGWKKLRGGLITKLRIPEHAKRSHAFGRKCRASEAEVIAIYDGPNAVEKGWSMHDGDFPYTVGKTVKPSLPFSENWTDECASGIHFFITREEAEAY